jgi:hypothetical protein
MVRDSQRLAHAPVDDARLVFAYVVTRCTGRYLRNLNLFRSDQGVR